MLYDHPEYYEVAFSFRDIAHEVRFMRECIDRFSRIRVRTALEIACGPAPYAGEMARHGYQYVGLDLNGRMLSYAEEKWRHLKPAPQYIRSDMVSFESPMKVDFALVMLGSLYLSSQGQMKSHFDSMASILNPGGLYLLDWCIQFSDPLQDGGTSAYRIEKDGVSVESRFKIRSVDPQQQTYEEVWSIDINDHGECLSFDMVEYNRAIFPQEFLDFIDRRQDFEFVGWWKDLDLQQPIRDTKGCFRPITVIRRTGAPDHLPHKQPRGLA